MKSLYITLSDLASSVSATLAATLGKPINADGHQDVWIGANGLIDAEEVEISILIGDEYRATGIVLSAGSPPVNLLGNAQYTVSKDTTDQPIDIWYTLGTPNP